MPVMPGALPLQYAGETLELLPDRAAWLPARHTLLVADVHLGKGAAFRRAGIPVPAGGSEKDVARLDALLRATDARRLVVLGDLVHARTSHQAELLDAVARWRAAHAGVAVLLVRGNHDRGAGRVPAAWDVREVEEPFDDGGLVFAHVPRHDQTAPVVAGHVHPVLALRDFDRSTVRVPCFVLDVLDDDRGSCLTLPAFGSFTGGHRVTAGPRRKVYPTSGRRVVAAG